MRAMVTTIQGVELPVALQPGRRWSDEELLGFCGESNEPLGVERDATGELMLMSPAGSASGGGNAALTGQLFPWARQDGRGKSFDTSAGWTLQDGSMLSPDASWVSWPRWRALTYDEQWRFAPLCPEFVVELRSRSDSGPALRRKMLVWLRNGAELGWLVDPFARTVEIFRSGHEPELVSGAEHLLAGGPVAGFDLDLTLLWSE